MRLWTILTESAWKSLNERGYLICDDEALGTEGFLSAYRWMMQQMEIRLGPAGMDIKLPLWGWHQYQGRRKKPIARKHQLPKGEKGYRLECHLPEEKLLLSDFTLWHHVLNNWYLPENETDHDAFDLEFDEIPEDAVDQQTRRQEVIEASWQRIFNLEWYSDYICAPRGQQGIQACFWRLEWAQVLRADPFVSR
jgi:hypothetical protein